MSAPWELQQRQSAPLFKKPMGYDPGLAAHTLGKAQDSAVKKSHLLAELGLADEEGIDVEDSEELEDEDGLEGAAGGLHKAKQAGHTSDDDGEDRIKVAHPQAHMYSSRATAASLEVEVQLLTQANRELQQQLLLAQQHQQAQAVLEQYEDDIRVLQARVRTLEQEGSEAHGTLQQLRAELQAAQQQLLRTTSQLQAAQSQLEAQAGQRDATTEQLQSELQAACAERDAAAQELQQAQQQLEAARTHIAAIAHQAEPAASTTSGEQEQVAALRAQVEELLAAKRAAESQRQMEVSTLEQQVQGLRAQVSELQQQQQPALVTSLSGRLAPSPPSRKHSGADALSPSASGRLTSPSSAGAPALVMPQLRHVEPPAGSQGGGSGSLGGASRGGAAQQEALQAALHMREQRLADALQEIEDLRRSGKRTLQEEGADAQRQAHDSEQAALLARDDARARAAALEAQLSAQQQEVARKVAKWQSEMQQLAGDKDAQHAAALQSALWAAQQQHTQRMTEVEAELKLVRQQLQQSKADLNKQADQAATSSKLRQVLNPRLQAMQQQLAEMHDFKNGILEDLLALQSELFNDKVLGQMSRLVRDKEIAVHKRAQQEAQAAVADAEKRAKEAAEAAEDRQYALEQQLRVQQLEMSGQLALLQTKWASEFEKRKKLHNLVLELRGNIRVLCRVRPLLPKESTPTEGAAQPVKVLSQEAMRVAVPEKGEREFEFDRVFGPQDGQDVVFSEVEALVTSVLDGYHVSIMAYGQTGSGKTHTMEGPEADPGVNARALTQLFKLSSEREADFSYGFTASVLEIYNEQIFDLLAGGKDQDADKLDVKQGPDGVMHVPGLRVEEVASSGDVAALIARGKANRSTFATNMNEHSSRSHLVLSLYVTATPKTPGAAGLRGKLHLVDLAGSERVGRTGAQGERLKEAQAINKSLSALGDVIAALQQRAPHIPYRNSKLTRLLEDSLGSNSRCVMVVNVSPAAENASETKCSLEFASRARKVELGRAKASTDAPPLPPGSAPPSTPSSANVTPLRGRTTPGGDSLSRVSSRNNMGAARRG